MSEVTVQCIYRHAIPGNKNLTPNEVILACDSEGNLITKRGVTYHPAKWIEEKGKWILREPYRSNKTSYDLWCQNPTMWMLSPDGIRYRKKMNSWNLREYWGNDIPFEHIDKPDPNIPIGLGNQPIITPEYKDKYGDYFLVGMILGFVAFILWFIMKGG